MDANKLAIADQLIVATYGTHVPADKQDLDRVHTSAGTLYSISNMVYDTHPKDARKLGHYHYIPYYIDSFIDIINTLHVMYPQNNHFVDVGCGIGDKLVLAKDVLGFDHVSGVEYDPTPYAIAYNVLKDTAHTLICDDANKVDFSQFNFIYLYCPIHMTDLMRELFTHVATTAPEGAIIIDMLPNYAHPRDAEFSDLFEDRQWNENSAFAFQKINGKLRQIHLP